MFLEKQGIRHYLGAPQITDLKVWKEEALKYIINWFHGGHLYLEYPIGIVGGLNIESQGFYMRGFQCQKPLIMSTRYNILQGGLL
jgi:hypothetical protein